MNFLVREEMVALDAEGGGLFVLQFFVVYFFIRVIAKRLATQAKFDIISFRPIY